MPDVEYAVEPGLPVEEFIDVPAGLNTNLILLAAPKAETYYPHIGLLHHNACWRIAGQ